MAILTQSISTTATNSPTDQKKGSTKHRVKLHYYSPSIAKQLNPKQPDVTAATLLTNLSLWQANFYPSTLINGRRHSFRSLSQLAEDCPYLTKPAIHKALKRLEEALGDEFVINRDMDRLYFSIGVETRKKLEIKKRTRKEKEDDSTKMFSFLPADAIMTKSVRSAVLLQNLRHQIEHFSKPMQDEAGNKYGELSPVKLAPILNFSADTISRSLNEMCEQEHLIRHETERSFYRLPNKFDVVTEQKAGNPTRAEVHAKTAEIRTPPAVVHEGSAEIHSQPAEVHSNTPPCPLQTIDPQWIAEIGLTGCINECGNESRNECLKDVIKDSDNTARTSSVCVPPQLSEGLMMLMDLAEMKLAKLRLEGSGIKVRASVHQDELPYDVIDPYELHYEFVSERERTFQAELDDGIDSLKVLFKDSGHLVTSDDEAKFRRFLTDNPKVDAMDLWDLYGKMIAPPLVFTSLKAQESHPHGILTKVKTPAQFLKYLPQIIVLLYQVDEEDFDDVKIHPPFDNLNYAYLGKAPHSSIIVLDDGSVPIELVEE